MFIKYTPRHINPLFDHGEWAPHERRVKQYAFRRVIDSDLRIRPGVRLYHGTWNPDLVFEPNRQTFFAIEPMMAMWYTLEEAEKMKEANRVSGVSYVYEFEVVEPIRIDRYIDQIREHPRPGETCVHPQVALRGYHALRGPFDLSLEITLMEKDGIELRKKYKVDTLLLQNYVSCPHPIVYQTVDELRFFSPGERYPLRSRLSSP